MPNNGSLGTLQIEMVVSGATPAAHKPPHRLNWDTRRPAARPTRWCAEGRR
jgi:hypothetical protein